MAAAWIYGGSMAFTHTKSCVNALNALGIHMVSDSQYSEHLLSRAGISAPQPKDPYSGAATQAPE